MAPRLVPNQMIVVQETNDGAVLVDVATGDCFELNRVGAEVWKRLCQDQALDEIVDALSRSYAASRTSIASDVAALVEQLAHSGILVTR